MIVLLGKTVQLDGPMGLVGKVVGLGWSDPPDPGEPPQAVVLVVGTDCRLREWFASDVVVDLDFNDPALVGWERRERELQAERKRLADDAGDD